MMQYINYLNISEEGAQAFLDAQLDGDLNVARSVLLGIKQNPFFSKRKNLTHYSAKGLGREEVRANHLEKINRAITYVLELIGRHSNSRFGCSAAEQHRYFLKPAETETFFLHLYISIQQHKQVIISQRSNEATNYMPQTLLQDWSKEIRQFEQSSEPYFVNGDITYSEKQLYAAGVFYLTSFLFDDLQTHANIAPPQRFFALKEHFKNGIDYRKVDQTKGGRLSGVTRAKNKEEAYQLFKQHSIYEKSLNEHNQVYHSVAARKLMEIADIDAPIERVEGKWIPEFIKRYQKEKGIS